MLTFKDELARRMKALGMKEIHLGQKLGHSRNGTVGKVLKKGKPVPMDDLENWLDALELSPRERDKMWRLAIRDYAPDYVKKMLADLDNTRKTLERLQRELRGLASDDELSDA